VVQIKAIENEGLIVPRAGRLVAAEANVRERETETEQTRGVWGEDRERDRDTDTDTETQRELDATDTPTSTPTRPQVPKPDLREGSNRFSQAPDVYWRSPGSGG